MIRIWTRGTQTVDGETVGADQPVCYTGDSTDWLVCLRLMPGTGGLSDGDRVE